MVTEKQRESVDSDVYLPDPDEPKGTFQMVYSAARDPNKDGHKNAAKKLSENGNGQSSGSGLELGNQNELMKDIRVTEIE